MRGTRSTSPVTREPAQRIHARSDTSAQSDSARPLTDSLCAAVQKSLSQAMASSSTGADAGWSSSSATDDTAASSSSSATVALLSSTAAALLDSSSSGSSSSATAALLDSSSSSSGFDFNYTSSSTGVDDRPDEAAIEAFIATNTFLAAVVLVMCMMAAHTVKKSVGDTHTQRCTRKPDAAAS